MNTKTIVAAIIGFALGATTYGLVDRLLLQTASSSPPQSTAEHWRVVEQFRDYVRNPANYRRDTKTGLSVMTPRASPMVSLAALVDAGELRHVDLVLPKVPKNRQTNQCWMKWAEDHKDVLYATGNPSYTAVAPSGDPPLHINLWFRDHAEPDVQQLIKDLEKIAVDGR